MKSQVVFVICLVMVVGFGMLNAKKHSERPEIQSDGKYDEDQYDETSKRGLPAPNDEKPKKTVEDINTESRAFVQRDERDFDAFKNKGFCQWGAILWYKPRFHIRCNCMKCTCKVGGKWDCAYNFAYCPYYYCGNHIYDPSTRVCCCGKLYAKKVSWNCCGFAYYDSRTSKCCNYYTVKPKAVNCPRY